MNLTQIDQLLTRAIAEMANREISALNPEPLTEGEVIRFPVEKTRPPAEGKRPQVKASAETAMPSKREKTAPIGHPQGKISDLKRGEKVIIAPAKIYGGDYAVWRNQGDEYVAAVPGYGSKAYKSLRGPLSWLLRETEDEPHIQEKIFQMFDAKILKGKKPKPPPSEKPKVVNTAQTPTRRTSINKGETVVIHQGGKRKDWYVERTTAGTYVAVGGPKMVRAKTLEQALNWLEKRADDNNIRRKIQKAFDLGGIKAGNAPPEERPPMGSLTPKMTKAEPPQQDKTVGYTEKQLFDHLKTLREPNITVFQLKAAFGGTSQQHTRWLQKRVKEGKLNVRREPGIGFAIYSLAQDPAQSKRKQAMFDALSDLLNEIGALDAFYRGIEYSLDMKGSGTGTEVQKLRDKIKSKHGSRWSAQQAYILMRDMARDIEKAVGKDIPIRKSPEVTLQGRTDSDLFMDIQRLATKKAKSIRAKKDILENTFSGPISDEEAVWWQQVLKITDQAEHKAKEMDYLARQMRFRRKELASKKALTEPDAPSTKAGSDVMPAAKDVAKFAAQIQHAVNRLTDDYSKRFPRTIRATKRRKFYAIDVDGSGWLLIAPGGNIIGIKGYGVPHYGKRYGNLYDFIKKGGDLRYSTFTANLKPYTSAMAKEYK